MDSVTHAVGDTLCLWGIRKGQGPEFSIKDEVVVTVKSVGKLTLASNEKAAFIFHDNEWLPIQHDRDMKDRLTFKNALRTARELRQLKQEGVSSAKAIQVIDHRPWKPDPKISVTALSKSWD